MRATEESGETVLPPITILQAPPVATAAATADVTFDLSGSNGRSTSQVAYASASYTGAGDGATSYAAGYAAGAGDAYRDFNRDVYRDFNRIDRNRDGLLSYPEISYDMADSNRDGVIDYNEYSAGYRGRGYSSNTTGGYDVVDDFKRIDKNGDGILNSTEMAFDYADTNKSGKLGFGQYAAARFSGILPG